MAYVETAPPTLIRLYESRSAFDGSFTVNVARSILHKLLCDRRMTRTWKTIRKHVKNDEGYEQLWKNIIYALANARKTIRATDKTKLGDITKAREKVYGDIEKRARELSELIAEPQLLPTDGATPLYTGELDLPAYNFLPEDVASTLGATSFATMSTDERRDWAHSLLREWPTMVELLDQLAIMAGELGSNNISLAIRDRGNAYWIIFIRKLYEYFITVNRKFEFIAFAPIKDITNLAMVASWERQRKDGNIIAIKPKPFTSKKVRGVICGASGKKLPIKGSIKEAAK